MFIHFLETSTQVYSYQKQVLSVLLYVSNHDRRVSTSYGVATTSSSSRLSGVIIVQKHRAYQKLSVDWRANIRQLLLVDLRRKKPMESMELSSTYHRFLGRCMIGSLCLSLSVSDQNSCRTCILGLLGSCKLETRKDVRLGCMQVWSKRKRKKAEV